MARGGSPRWRGGARHNANACWWNAPATSYAPPSPGSRLRFAKASEPLRDDPADLLAGVLLEEVAGVLDRPRRGKIELRGDPLAHRERQYWVGVRPEDQRRAVVAPQRVGDPFALDCARRLWLGRQDQGKGPGAGRSLRAPPSRRARSDN